MTTIAQLLFGAGGAVEGARHALDLVTGAARGFSVAGLTVPTQDVASAVAAALEVPVGTLALQGWAHHRQVVAARRRTAQDPEARETVRLMEHAIRSSQRPEVTVDVNGVRTSLLELTVMLQLRMRSADLVIERGRIASAWAGSADGAVRLLAGTTTLAEKEFVHADVTPPSSDEEKPGHDGTAQPS